MRSDCLILNCECESLKLEGFRRFIVTDGSCMASTACQNPSLTFMALTARACDYAVKELKKRNI